MWWYFYIFLRPVANSYKPIVALVLGFFLINETPGYKEILGIILIIIGTLILGGSKLFLNKATMYRFIALVLLVIAEFI